MDIIFHGYKENNYNLLEINSKIKKRNEDRPEYHHYIQPMPYTQL